MKLAANAAGTEDRRSSKENKTMKALIKFALAAAILAITCAAQTEWMGGWLCRGAYVLPNYRKLANAVPYGTRSYSVQDRSQDL